MGSSSTKPTADTGRSLSASIPEEPPQPANNIAMDLFAPTEPQRTGAQQPLAVRMRPRTLEEFVGQLHIVGPGKLLRRAIEADRLTSLILYRPPGTGKTA